MKMTCPKCGADYNISDAQIPPGGLQIKCLKCLSSFMAQPGGRSIALTSGSMATALQSSSASPGLPDLLQDSPDLSADLLDDVDSDAEAQMPVGTYFLTLAAGHVVGPLDLGAIQQMLREGRLNGSERASLDRVHWLPAKSFPDLAALFQKSEEMTRAAAQAMFKGQTSSREGMRLSQLASFELGDSLPNMVVPSIEMPQSADDFDFDFGDLPAPKAQPNPPALPTARAPSSAPGFQSIGHEMPKTAPRVASAPQNKPAAPNAAHFFDDLDDLPAPAAEPPVPVFDDLPAPLDFDLPGMPEEPDLLEDPALQADVPLASPDDSSPIELDLPSPSLNANLPGRAMPRDLPGRAMPRDLPGQPLARDLPGRAMPRDLPGQPLAPNLPGQPLAPNLPGQPLAPNLPGQPQPPDLSHLPATPAAPLMSSNDGFSFDEMPELDIPSRSSPNVSQGNSTERPSDSGGSGRFRGRFSQTDLPEFSPGNSAEDVHNAAVLMAQNREQKRKLLFGGIALGGVVIGVVALMMSQLGSSDEQPRDTLSRRGVQVSAQQPHQENATPAIVTEKPENKAAPSEAQPVADKDAAAPEKNEDSADTLPTADATLAEIAGYRERISRLELKKELSPEETVELVELYAFGSLEYSGNKVWAQKAQELSQKLVELQAEGAERAQLASRLCQGEGVEEAMAYGTAHPDEARAHYLAGHAALLSHDFEQALKAFGQAASLDETLLASARMEGDLALRIGKLDVARKTIESLYAKAPGAPAVVTALAQFEMSQGHQERALKLLAQVLSLEPKRLSPQERSKALLTRARLSLDAQRDESGMADLEESIRAWPQNLEAINLLSERHFATKNYEKALDQFELLRESNFDGPEIAMQIAQCHLALGQSEKAISTLEKGFKDFGGSASLAQQAELKSALGEVYLERHDFKKAMSIFEEALAIDAHCERALLGHANVLVREANTDAAIDYLEKAIKAHPNGALLHQGLGDLYRNIAETTADRDFRQKAVNEYRKSLAIEPAQIEARKSLGHVLLDLGEHAKALKEFESLSQRLDFHENLDFEIGKAQYRLGQVESALGHFRAALTHHQEMSELHLLLGASLFDLGQLNEARESLANAEQLDRSLIETNYYMGRIDLEEGKAEQALQRLRLAQDADKGNYVYRYWLGRALEANGSPEALKAARQEYDVVANACHHDAALTKKLCDVLYRRGSMRMNQRQEWGGARKDLSLAATCDPQNAEIHMKLGNLSEYESDWPTAVQHYSNAIKAAPERGDVYAARASALIMLDKEKDARNDLKQAIKLQPDLPEPYYQLCASMKDKSLSEAKKHCQKYLELSPNGINADAAREILR